MRVYFFSLLLVVFAFSCNQKTTSPVTGDAQGHPNPGLVGPPPGATDAEPGPSGAVVDLRDHAPTLADTSLLWRITAPGVAEPSYLFGTIHLIPEEDYFLRPNVIKAINDADKVVFEIDPREMQNPAALFGLMGKITMRNDTTLSDLLSDEEYATVEEYFSNTGLPFFLLKNMKPMFLSAMVGQDTDGLGGMGGLGGESLGLPGMKSYELELTKLAEAADKEISGLESIDFQLSIFDSIPYRAQAQMLHQAIVDDVAGEGSDAASQLDEMIALYRRQAIAELAQTITDESQDVARFEELLLTKRNTNWAPLIKKATEAGATGSSFYAVGAGHLGGENGVIALLRAAGLNVEPVY